jgi:hypothetical protein
MPFPAHHLICPSCQCAAGLFACDDGQITGTFPRVFCPHEGRFAIVTKRGAGDAVDAAGARDEGACRGRRSRGVLIPRRWYQALKKLTLLRGDGGNKARLSGETTKETVKTIARGMPDVSGVTVVTCLRAFYFCTQGCGRSGRPAFPAPSDFGAKSRCTTRAHLRGENARTRGIIVIPGRALARARNPFLPVS